MASNVGSLKILLSADLGRFTSDMGRAAGISDRQMKNIQRTAQRAMRVVALAAAAAGAAITAMTVQQFRQVDALAKQSDALGMTTEALAALDLQSRLAGSSLEAVTKAQSRLQRSISDANDGLSTQVRAFQALGIEVKDLLELTPEEQWRTVAEAIASMENPTQRNAAAMALLGRSAVNLMPLLLEGAEGFDRARRETERFGTAIDRVSAKQIEQANDSLTRVSEAGRGFGRVLAVQVAPFVEAFGRAVQASSADVDGMTNRVMFGMDIIVRSVGMVGNSLRGLHLIWRGLKVVAVSTVEGIVGILRSLEAATVMVVNSFSSLTGKTVSANAQFFATLHESLAATRRDMASDVGALMEETIPSEALDGWVERMRAASREAAEAVVANQPEPGSWDFPEEIVERVNEMAPESRPGFDALWSVADQAARNIQDAFAEFLFDPFKDGVKGMLRGFLDAIRRMVANAAAARIFSSFGLAGKLGAFIGATPPGNFSGTAFAAAGQPQIVGERGPELFVPKTGGAILPNGKGMGGGFSLTQNVTLQAGVDFDTANRLLQESERRLKADFQTFNQRGYMPG